MKAQLVQKVPMSDGVQLATDVWLPEGTGPFPVLLTRTPYHRAGALGSAQTYTEWGYAYVVQDCRGKYDSEGEFRPLVDEARDGRDTLDWVAGQRWCNGRIGLVGKSYLGIVQIPAASGGHEALRCIVPGVAPNSFFRDWLRYDGCFAFANAVRWSLTHAVCKTKPVIDHFTWDELYSRATLDDILERAGMRCPALVEWVDHDRYDDYWEAVDQERMYDQVGVPGLHIGGWFDHLTRGQFDAYRGIGERGATGVARAEQRLLIGPWGHSTVGARGDDHRRYGEWDFGVEGDFDVLAHERRFIDRWVCDREDGLSEEPPVHVFLMGENRWLGFDDWPPRSVEVQNWYLGEGRLTLEPAKGLPPGEYLYDPRNPTPILGGPIYWGLSSAGPVDQRPILGRPDVLYSCSAPLERSLAVVGEINLELWIASSAPDTDFVAKLCVVEPSGRVTCLTLGSLRCRYRQSWREPTALEVGTPTRIRLQMGHLAYVFPERSRIALLVTSSDFPRILPHPNTMAPTWKERFPHVAHQQVFWGSDTRSRLELPVLQL